MIVQRQVWITLVWYILAILFGLFIAILDVSDLLGERDNPSVLLLAMSAAFVGLFRRQKPWGLAIAIGTCLPVIDLVRYLLGVPDSREINGYTGILLMAVLSLTFCLIASFCGYLVRKTFFVQ